MSSTWRKVYEHNADGTARNGSLSTLSSVIGRGADIKVIYRLSGPPRVVWSRTMSSVTVTRPEGGAGGTIVSGILTDIPDTDVTGSGRDFANPSAHEWQSYNTTGVVVLRKFDAATGQVLDEQENRRRLEWWARSYRSSIFDLFVSGILDRVPRIGG